MKKEDEDDTGVILGWLLLIGVSSVSIGSGYVWGAGIGWIVFGALCLVAFVTNVKTKS